MISQDDRIRTEALNLASQMEEYSVTCQVQDGEVFLDGPVTTDEHSYQLEDAVRALPGVKYVHNSLSVEGFSATVDNVVEGVDLSPDFSAAPGTSDSLEADSEAEPYMPPTDPVVTTTGSAADDVEVLNGFSEPSGDESVLGRGTRTPRGDEELESLVLEALRLDAGTTDLDIAVRARDGVVTLRGMVASLEDADLAESVAAAVPGVEEVQEELTVEGM